MFSSAAAAMFKRRGRQRQPEPQPEREPVQIVPPTPMPEPVPEHVDVGGSRYNLNPVADKPWAGSGPEPYSGIYIRSAGAKSPFYTKMVEDALERIDQNPIGRLLLTKLSNIQFGWKPQALRDYKVIIARPINSMYPHDVNLVGEDLEGNQVDKRDLAQSASLVIHQAVVNAQNADDRGLEQVKAGLLRAAKAMLSLGMAGDDLWMNNNGPLQQEIKRATDVQQLKVAANKIDVMFQEKAPSTFTHGFNTGSAIDAADQKYSYDLSMGAAGTVLDWAPNELGGASAGFGGGMQTVFLPWGPELIPGNLPGWLVLGHELIHILHYVEGSKGTPYRFPHKAADIQRCRHTNDAPRVAEEWQTVGIQDTVPASKMYPACVDSTKSGIEAVRNCAITENNMRASEPRPIAPRLNYFQKPDPDCRLDAADNAVALPYSAAEAFGADFEGAGVGGPEGLAEEAAADEAALESGDRAACDAGSAADGVCACPACLGIL